MTLGDGTTINDGLTLDHRRKVEALRTLCRAIFDSDNDLKATDFIEVRVGPETDLAASRRQVSGREVKFFITNDALAKIADHNVADALDVL